MFVLIVSVVLILLGAFVALYGYFGLDIEETWKIGDDEFPSPLSIFAIAAVLVGLFTIVTGVLGALTAKCKNACFAVPFALFSLVLCIAMLVVAVIGFAVQGAADDVREKFCQGGSISIAGANNGNPTVYSGLEDYMQKMYGLTVDKYMCTGVCPCPLGESGDDYVQAYNEATKGAGK